MSKTLEELQKELDLINEKQKEILLAKQQIINKDKQKYIIEVKELMVKYNLEVKDLTKPKANYIGPEGQEWSGRGISPKWLKEEIAKGKTKEDFKIKEDTEENI